MARVDPEAAAQEEPWGPVRLKNGVAVSIFGWSAQWLFLAGVGGIVVETSLIEGGSGTWPHDDMPWISLGLICVAMAVMIVDLIVVGFHNRMVRRRK